jgi:hypothetical protein
MSLESEQKMTRPLRALKGEFVVPTYQRGYRWTKDQVEALLDDITAFAQQKKDKNAIYFLQPLVVCGDPGADQGPWEVIDGQQRLTTIFLMNAALRSILERGSIIPFKLTFASRPDSTGLLRKIAENPTIHSVPISIGGIDHFHIHQAWSTIYSYFSKLHSDGNDIDDIYRELAGYVHVLWHVIPAGDSTDSVRHFTRLNMGRIALTGAELSRALLLNPANHHMDKEIHLPPHTKEESAETFTARLFQRRQIILGSRWDDVEHGLREPDFWAFLGGQEPDNQPTRIDFLLDLYAEKPDKERREYYAFHQLEKQLRNPKAKDAQKIWDEITLDYQRLRSWYEDHNYYHWIGYLIRHGDRSSLRELLNLARKSKKTELAASIHQRIRESITKNGTPPELEDLEYGKSNPEILKILFLFNVEYVRQLQNSRAEAAAYRHIRRFPFGVHGSKKWSLEHIEAQNVEGIKKADWGSWILDHKKALSLINIYSLPNIDGRETEELENVRQELIEQCNAFLAPGQKDTDRDIFGKLSKSILAFMDSIRDESSKKMHGLGNMALLDLKNNITLSNYIFMAKRAILLEKMRNGEYIPPATEATFLRYFSEGDQVTPYWAEADRHGYMKQIRKTLSFFWPELLKEEESCVN